MNSEEEPLPLPLAATPVAVVDVAGVVAVVFMTREEEESP
jgi:hypothetical protein